MIQNWRGSCAHFEATLFDVALVLRGTALALGAGPQGSNASLSNRGLYVYTYIYIYVRLKIQFMGVSFWVEQIF